MGSDSMVGELVTPARQGTVPYVLNGAFYRMAFVEWGAPDAKPVVCVHGLTRTGRDFDALGQALADGFRVICPDLPGRGASDWLPDGALYQPLSYVQALSHLLAWIGQPVLWVGTSLGGICGMAIAAATGQPITRLVLNDVGPHIPAEALRRIRDYISLFPDFASVDLLESYLRRVHAPFGDLTDGQWAQLARSSARMLATGRVALHYDPAIAAPIRAVPMPGDADMWAWWDRIKIPVLALRGEQSDLLQPETLSRMQAAGARTHVVPNCGHAPALMDAKTIAVLRRFLEEG